MRRFAVDPLSSFPPHPFPCDADVRRGDRGDANAAHHAAYRRCLSVLNRPSLPRAARPSVRVLSLQAAAWQRSRKRAVQRRAVSPLPVGAAQQAQSDGALQPAARRSCAWRVPRDADYRVLAIWVASTPNVHRSVARRAGSKAAACRFVADVATARADDSTRAATALRARSVAVTVDAACFVSWLEC